MQLVSNPWQFDVMVLTNLYGTIVSNIICGLIGGPGILSGANYGPRYAIFETGTRNSAVELAGTNTANPCAMLNASADLLEHLRMPHHATVVREAVDETVNEDKVLTGDVGGSATTSEVVQNVVSRIRTRLDV